MSNTVTPSEAAALIASTDSLAIPLGPGAPGQFLHALADVRDAWDDLRLFGALMPDLYEVLLRPGVSMQSGFFGPAERFMLAGGARIEFVPADFRRFAPVLEQIRPRVMATAAATPDADGWMSLSLHAGASVAELQRAAAEGNKKSWVNMAPAAVATG